MMNRKRLEEQLANLVLDADGVLSLDGRRVMILSAEFVTRLSVEGDEVIGPAIGGIHYLAGERSGRQLAEIGRKKAPEARPADILRELMGELEVRGLGRLEIVALDLTAGSGSLQLRRSAWAEAFPRRDRPACYGPAGLWAGLIATLSGKDVVAEEVRCRVKGDAFCEIVASRRSA